MTANVQDERKTAAQRKAQRARQLRENPRHGRGRVAEQLVRDWDAATRARIRASLLQLRWFGGDGGEMQVIGLIDQISEEERCG